MHLFRTNISRIFEVFLAG